VLRMHRVQNWGCMIHFHVTPLTFVKDTPIPNQGGVFTSSLKLSTFTFTLLFGNQIFTQWRAGKPYHARF
jgi:hypothetical protein